MSRVQWARASQFNWAFDNMGGTPLQEAVAGSWDQAVGEVAGDGRVTVTAPNPGGGRVYYVRGVWTLDAMFPWAGFWADPIGGDRTNYYQGGSFANQEARTCITLGTPLPPGTPVQLYYIYLTGEWARKYEPLNNYPCIRRACRSRDDFTYDFAVDRILDLMVFLHFAGLALGRDNGPLIRFLWNAFETRQESRVPPLMRDDFERQTWDRGPHLLYRGVTPGAAAFQVFQIEPAPEAPGRALHVRAGLPTTTDAAWFGYGLDWSLQEAPFKGVDRVSFRLQGRADTRRLHNLTKIGSGSATLVLNGDYDRREKRRFLVEMETTGAVGEAAFKWSRDGGLTWEAAGLISGGPEHPVALGDGLEVYWEGGGGTDLVAGDYWTFWGGEPAVHPRRLLVALNDSPADAAEPWSPEHTYVHAVPDRFSQFTDFVVPFSQFWRRDNLIEDCDRVQARWGAWYAATQQDASDITIGLREEAEVLYGDVFYTQRAISWDLSPYVTAFGAWAGLDPGCCNSTGRTGLNFLLKPVIPGVAYLTVRVKVKDARGSYFFRDVTVQSDAWQRVAVDLADLLLESGTAPLTHPLQAVDLGIPGAPPSNGVFYLTDLKFDEHLAFPGERLRLLEFKMEQQGLADHEWWLDEVNLNLTALDPYPYAPRLAISLTPYGQNPWRGPTPVHYAQPLAPHLVGALSLAQTYLNLHRDAQEEFHRRYGGVRGPILPVHTRNDIENVADLGCEDFNRFSWWPRYRSYGKTVGAWLFNDSLVDGTGTGHDLAWTAGSPTYTTGICQPGNTGIVMSTGTNCPYFSPGTDFLLGSADFTLETIIRFNALGTVQCLMSVWDNVSNQRSWYFRKNAANQLELLYSVDGINTVTVTGTGTIGDADYHHLTLTRSGTLLTFYLDGQPAGQAAIAAGTSFFAANTAFRLGRQAGGGQLVGAIDYAAVHKGRAMSAAEIAGRWQIARGQLNGSAYPEVGCGLGQYWAFQRLAEYFYVSGDTGAREVLENWLAWLDAHGAADGSGWKFPNAFSDYGFAYGSYDPGATAAIALGCLYIYLRHGNVSAQTWARRLLDDLGENRRDPEIGGYQSDCHYAWLNALVLRLFGLAVNGAPGQSYPFPATDRDRDYFDAQAAWILAHPGDAKPNVLNADLIPFTLSENTDNWANAPHYLTMAQMGTLEGVVLMLGAALEYAKIHGDWTWWQKLLDFIILDNLVVLGPSQIRALTAASDQAGLRNVVRVRYADYDRDNRKYAEARAEAAIRAWGERALDLDFRYGGPVVLEDGALAQTLASRLLQRLEAPWEAVEVETWLEGARLELGDTVAVSSDFHGLDRAEFTLFGKDLDLGSRRVRLSLSRPLNQAWAWAVDLPGGSAESWAIDQASPYDANWDCRADIS
jgi:hypothetical protein